MSWLTYRTGWDPFSELNRLQREMNRLFDGYGSASGDYRFPLLNLWSNGEEAIVTAELPGMDPAQIELNIVKNQLTIQGERKAEELSEGHVCHRSEREAGTFVRTVMLPFEVEDGKTHAKYEKGVLTVRMPRSEATKPRKVQIEAH